MMTSMKPFRFKPIEDINLLKETAKTFPFAFPYGEKTSAWKIIYNDFLETLDGERKLNPPHAESLKARVNCLFDMKQKDTISKLKKSCTTEEYSEIDILLEQLLQRKSELPNENSKENLNKETNELKLEANGQVLKNATSISPFTLESCSDDEEKRIEKKRKTNRYEEEEIDLVTYWKAQDEKQRAIEDQKQEIQRLRLELEREQLEVRKLEAENQRKLLDLLVASLNK